MSAVDYNPGLFWELVEEREPRMLIISKKLNSLQKGFGVIQNEIDDLKDVLDNKSLPYFRKCENDGPESLLVKSAMMKAGMKYCKFHYVPSDYYQRPLTHRRDLLKSPSVHHLCKSVLIENVNHEGPETRKNSRYYVVLVQYTHKIDYDMLQHSLIKLNQKEIKKSKFSFRVAENSFEVTGFRHNALSPFGSKREIPQILSSSIAELSPRIMFLGGGHEDVKIELRVEEFVQVLKPLVLRTSAPKDWKTEDRELTETFRKKGRKKKVEEEEEDEGEEEEIPIGKKPKQKQQQPQQKKKKQKQKQKKQNQQKKKGKKGGKKGRVQIDYSNPNPHIFDIRVGKILDLEPLGEKLYKETIDVGEAEPRTICSGLNGKIPMETMKGALVLVMVNLKPSKMAGVFSNGMILVASTPDETYDLPQLSKEAVIGDRVRFEGCEFHEPVPRVPPKRVKPLLVPFKSDNERVVRYGDYIMKLKGENVYSENPNSNVS